MPDGGLIFIQRVELTIPASRIISHQYARAVCSICGEEVINEREVVVEGKAVCKTCAYGGYYQVK